MRSRKSPLPPHRPTHSKQIHHPFYRPQDNFIQQNEAANQFVQLERYEEAAQIYASLLEKKPGDTILLANLGGALTKLGRHDEAKTVLEYALELDPQNINARINLGGVLQAKKDFHAAIRNALEAVSLSPTSAVAFNNLGCAFGGVNMMHEALHAYQTAQQLDPDHLEAGLNVAMTLIQLGRIEEGLASYEALLNKIPASKPAFKEVVKFYASFPYLQIGNLSIGWEYYESGFNELLPNGAARTPNRKFNCPQWQGEDLSGRKLLVWREQGLGDELMFSSILIDLMASEADITFECTQRLVNTYRRSFPQLRVQAETINIMTGEFICTETYDYHIPVGSLPRILRKSISDFEKQRPFIQVDVEQQQLFRDRLQSYRGKKLIGICWRSGVMDPLRNREFSSLLDWKDIFTMPECTFVNLQYGDCEAEISEAEQRFGVKIIRWPDVDLKNELDRVFSLMSCLDCVITAPTAVYSMAGALGLPTYMLCGQRPWNVLGSKPGIYPWFPNTLILDQPHGKTAAHSLPEIPRLMRMLFEN